MIAQAIGGLGLFLLGMALLTENLRALSSRSLRRGIARFAGTAIGSVVTGAIGTAIIQSSSVTSVTAVGLVNAGAMTFDQALGVVLGANAGTTVTGWLVAWLGFKLDISAYTLPLIAIGVLMRMVGRGRFHTIGMALVGFGLIFLGIDFLRGGMAGLNDLLTPETFPPDTLPGRVALVGIGLLLTLITQSSSAGVAMTLAALAADRLSFVQAACLVIGFDIGTTVTAVIASIGGATAAKRTVASHVVFNVCAAVGAFIMLPLYAMALEDWFEVDIAEHAEFALVGFHTLFNVVGVVATIPLIPGFARLIVRMLPDRGIDPTRRLSASLKHRTEEALDQGVLALAETAQVLFSALRRRIAEKRPRHEVLAELETLQRWQTQIEDYLGEIGAKNSEQSKIARHVAALHADDHIERLIDHGFEEHLCERMFDNPDIAGCARLTDESLQLALSWLGTRERDSAICDRLAAHATSIAEQRRALRPVLLARTARAELDVEDADRLLETLLWLDRVAYHAWRFVDHMQRQRVDNGSR